MLLVSITFLIFYAYPDQVVLGGFWNFERLAACIDFFRILMMTTKQHHFKCTIYGRVKLFYIHNMLTNISISDSHIRTAYPSQGSTQITSAQYACMFHQKVAKHWPKFYIRRGKAALFSSTQYKSPQVGNKAREAQKDRPESEVMCYATCFWVLKYYNKNRFE